jgi:hypothetical protein
MGQINAGILQPIDFAGRVREGFQHGQQQRRQMEMDKALQALAANPQDPQAIANITRYNPEMGMRLQSQRAEQEAAKAKQLTEVFGRAARAAKTPEQWDAIATWLSQNGVPGAANVVGKFSPEARLGYMAQAGLEDDAQDPTSMERNYEFLKTLPNGQQLAEQYIRGQSEGQPLMANNGDGTFTIIPRSMLGGQVGVPQGQQASAPPPPPGFVLDGGPTPQASGGFPVGPR